MGNKTENTDFFIKKLSNYISLEDVYIYKKIADQLEVGIESEAYRGFPGDYIIKINLSGTEESMDKLNEIWNKREEIKKDLDKIFLSYLKERIND